LLYSASQQKIKKEIPESLSSLIYSFSALFVILDPILSVPVFTDGVIVLLQD
jgi:hypothetical protein